MNNTIAYNRFGQFVGGLWVDVPEQGYVGIYNNIIYGNEDGDLVWQGSPTLEVFNNDFDQSFVPAVDPSNLNNVDPLFVEPAQGNYHLQPTSPVINKGLNTAPKLPAKDIEGKPRIHLGRVDMGAYEVAGASSPGVPSKPAPASGAAGVSLTPTLAWAGGAGATSFDVYFGTAASPPFVRNTTGMSFTPAAKLAPNTLYRWRIVAKNSSGTTRSLIWTFRTAAAAPTSPSPANGATGVLRTPTLTWAAGLGAVSHDVYFGTTTPPPKVANVTGTSYVPGALSATKKYYWKVVAKTSGGVATSSPVWSFTTR